MCTENLKKVNLEHIQKLKTLIVVHYRGKRLSIPLFESVENITEYLWHQIHKFENTVFEKEDKPRNNKIKNGVNDIVGFTSFEHDKTKVDIKMDILLSMSRLYRDIGKSRSDVQLLDITAYYKYLQIEPYYGSTGDKELIPEYQLYSVLGSGPYFTVYLGRRISDGRFYSIKICKADSKLAHNEYASMKTLHHQQSKIDHKGELQLIPQIMEIRKTDGLYIYIYECKFGSIEDCPGGTLRNALKKKIKEIECLHYMKQLVWGIHTLHCRFNLVHRALCFQNIEVDFVGNLRLLNFAYCQPCFSPNYLMNCNYSIPESYEQKYEIPCVTVPPEVQRSGKYNNLVDYFGIGLVLSQMFSGSSPRDGVLRGEKEGIQIAIENLMAENIKQREIFCNEIVAELQEEKVSRCSSSSKRSENLEHERLTMNKIYTGESINIEQKTLNGIKHQQSLKIMKASHDDQFYFLHPVGKMVAKSKNKVSSKERSKLKNRKKTKSKDKVPSTGKIPSQSFTSHEKSRKLLGKVNEKLLNKSIDSKGHSVKSGKSKSSNSRSKGKPIEHTSSGFHHNKSGLTPVRSPPKSSVHKSYETVTSSKGLLPNKSKTRL